MKPFLHGIHLAIASSFLLLGIESVSFPMPAGSDTTTTVAVDLDSRVEFQCQDGKTHPTSSWLIDNDATSDGGIRISDEDPLYEKSSSSIGSVLAIKSVDLAMNWTRYKCESAGGWVRLRVNPMKPSIQGIPSSIKAELGEVLVVRYRVVGAPKPHIDWRRDLDTITGGGTDFNDTTLIHPIGMSTFFNGSIYTITATNSEGTDTKQTTLLLYYLTVSCSNVSPWNKGTTISCNIKTFPALKSVVLQRPVGIQQNATTQKDVDLSHISGHPPHESVVTFAIPETGYGGKYVVAADNGRNQTTKVLTIDGPTPPALPTTRAPTRATQAPTRATQAPTRATQTPAKNDDNKKGGLGWWVYFVIVLVCLLVVGAVVVLLIYYKRRQKSTDAAPIVSTMEMPANEMPPKPPVSETTLDNPTYTNGTRKDKPNPAGVQYAVLDFSQKNGNAPTSSSGERTDYSTVAT